MRMNKWKALPWWKRLWYRLFPSDIHVGCGGTFNLIEMRPYSGRQTFECDECGVYYNVYPE